MKLTPLFISPAVSRLHRMPVLERAVTVVKHRTKSGARCYFGQLLPALITVIIRQLTVKTLATGLQNAQRGLKSENRVQTARMDSQGGGGYPAVLCDFIQFVVI